MNKIRELYFKYASLAGIILGLLIIISSEIFKNKNIDTIIYFDYTKNKTMPYYIACGKWLGIFIIILSIRKIWFQRFFIQPIIKFFSKKTN